MKPDPTDLEYVMNGIRPFLYKNSQMRADRFSLHHPSCMLRRHVALYVSMFYQSTTLLPIW